MKTWYKCTFKSVSREPPITYEFKLCIEFGEDIIEKCYTKIQSVYSQVLLNCYLKGTSESFDIKKFVEYVKNKMKINKITSDVLERKTSIQEIFECLYPLKTIKMLNPITKIEETYGCIGCSNDSLGQKYHMECPCGCLHDVVNCDFCRVILDAELHKNQKLN